MSVEYERLLHIAYTLSDVESKELERLKQLVKGMIRENHFDELLLEGIESERKRAGCFPKQLDVMSDKRQPFSVIDTTPIRETKESFKEGTGEECQIKKNVSLRKLLIKPIEVNGPESNNLDSMAQSKIKSSINLSQIKTKKTFEDGVPSRELMRKKVVEAHEQGLSYRQIGELFQISKSQAHRICTAAEPPLTEKTVVLTEDIKTGSNNVLSLNKRNFNSLSSTEDFNVVYVDGSFGEGNVYGIGYCFEKNGELEQPFVFAGLSKEIDNSTKAELLSALKAVEEAVNRGYSNLLIKYDNTGIERHANTKPASSQSFASKYYKLMQLYKKQIQITFEHVKAHSGILGNEIVDTGAGVARKEMKKALETLFKNVPKDKSVKTDIVIPKRKKEVVFYIRRKSNKYHLHLQGTSFRKQYSNLTAMMGLMEKYADENLYQVSFISCFSELPAQLEEYKKNNPKKIIPQVFIKSIKEEPMLEKMMNLLSLDDEFDV